MTYYCGVNISNGRDHLCGNGASASGVTIEHNERILKSFENVNNNTGFPMVSATVVFSNKNTANGRFRGWDVLNRANSTKLAAKSGNGD